ncbi:uncharacterized protein LOC111014503 isoform X2 [Momordica charantia]|uniref:Uncharacterized protein LOC111014503 isoform X2 n=1 Tax=Momordica charantia TaxID=3673 RepID=A0A6J1CV62_MOMCH|nr:uncharacterized protein LOC111014503 isoform X2 [Momordica charantia]
MGGGQVSLQNFLSIPTVGCGFRPKKSGRKTGPEPRLLRSRTKVRKCVVRSRLADRSPPKSTVDVDRLVDFLYEDLRHVFDAQGIDPTAYDEHVRFRDPITKYNGIRGYMLNIALLRQLFRPQFLLHWVKKTGPYEITTRWTAVMKFVLLPWKPELVLTGTSIMDIDPETGKFCNHVDLWDSVQNNNYFSLEGLWDIFKQFRFYETPELESPQYQILKRTANYEVRKYAPFISVETGEDKLYGSAVFNRVAVFPDPKQDAISLRTIDGGIAAVLKFSGKPSENMVQEKAKELRYSLIKDGLKPIKGCLLARYNDPSRTWSFVMRNEVLIWLEEFSF